MPRAIWSGTISFGLVTVPVKVYSAVKQKDVSFHQLEEGTGARIKYKRVSAKTGKEVPYDKIVKGYELSRDRYVEISPEELEKADPKATRSIDIEDFVPLDEIDPVYYERPYYLVPDKGGAKAYRLLVKAMEADGRVALGRFVMRTKEYLAAIRPRGNALMLETMLFPDEVVDAKDLDGIPDSSTKVAEKELKMARTLIESLSTEFEPKRYHDRYRERVLKLIEEKAETGTIEVTEVEEDRPKVTSLMDALKASIEEGERGQRKKSGGKRKTA